MKLRVLSFVNHVPIKSDPTGAIERALEHGVDYVIAQGTGKDWGPHWLGSGQQFPVTNFVENVRPYMRLCFDRNIRFVLSVGIAGARPQLRECLDGFNAMCAEERISFDIGVVSGDVDHDFLREQLSNGVVARRMDDHPLLSEHLTLEDVDASTYVVAQMGPEPIIRALESGVDGVVAGRSLDVGLFMAPAIRAGASLATAALFGKLLECAGVALDPGDASLPIYGEIDDDDSIVIRSLNDKARCTVQSLAAHSFYERMNPFREENPGGYLDLEDVVYEQLDEESVRVSGARWVPTPYAVKLEGAAPYGFRAINLTAVREPRYIEHLPWVVDRIKEEVRATPRFSSLEEGVDYHLNFTLYGRDAVLGDAEPCRGQEHEVGVLIDVLAPTQEIARDICYYASISHQIGPYPGRKTTAGNTAQRFTQLVNPVGEAYRWSIWHLLPLDDPCLPFEQFRAQMPYSEGAAPW